MGKLKIISMKQLREEFTPIKKGLQKGKSYLLMYRSKPLCTLNPFEDQQISTAQKPQNKKKNTSTKKEKSQKTYNLKKVFHP